MRTGEALAKVNLALHVTGRRADGYHLLDSAVAFGRPADVLTVTEGDGLTVTGPFAAGVPTDDSNLIRRALSLAGTRRAVTLDKRLPHPAGLGGGSSDAACVLRLVDADLPVEALLTLGADVPVCVFGQAARMRGIGEQVMPLDLPPIPAVLVNPGLPVPTRAVFAALATPDNPPMDTPDVGMDLASALDWLARQRNDLEAPAISAAPDIATVLAAIGETGALVRRMSGSGATCFGLYPDRATAGAAARRLTRPGWWVQATTLT